MATWSVNGLKGLFSVLGCVMVVTLLYTISTDGLPFRRELLTPWMAATLVDFYINVVALAAWVSYKESNWVSAILWIILLVCFGSITTCAYIVLQLSKLSVPESIQDAMYHVLLHNQSKNGTVQKRKFSPVVTAKIIFSLLGLLMLGTLIYTLLTDGSPFRKELFTPWMKATLIDFYINVVALSVWVAYKESSWISAFLWIILLICFGSITTCVYIVQQLFQLSSGDPLYLVLLNNLMTARRDHIYLRCKAHRGAKASWGLEKQNALKACAFLSEARHISNTDYTKTGMVTQLHGDNGASQLIDDKVQGKVYSG